MRKVLSLGKVGRFQTNWSRDFEFMLYRLRVPAVIQAWKAIFNLLARDWWYRVWILPESTCPIDTYFFCGQQCISWTDLEAVERNFTKLDHHLATMDSSDSPLVVFNNFIPFLRLRKLRLESKKLEIQTLTGAILLHLSRAKKGQDAREYLYTVLALAENSFSCEISPDYSKSVEEVYVNFAKAKRPPGDELVFLGLLEPRHLHPGRSSTFPGSDLYLLSEGLTNLLDNEVFQWESHQSFLPSWRNSLFPNRFPERLYRVDGNIPANISYYRDRLLAQGFTFDRIAEVRRVDADGPYYIALKKFQKWTDDFQRAFPYHDRTNKAIQALTLRTLMADTYPITDTTYRWGRDSDYDSQAVKKAIVKVRGREERFQIYANGVLAIFHGVRKLAWTERGYMGLVPLITEPGDQICVLLRREITYIFRDNMVDWSQLYMIGEACMPGLMDGEATVNFLDGNKVQEEVFVIV